VPIGFIQYYHASQVGDGWWPDELPGTVGTDQFIGEKEYINRGYGTAMLQAFVRELQARPEIKKIITEADPQNARAIQCYVNAGFRFVKEIHTPDGVSNLYEFTKELS
jgi:RimJ/RimL family protein N-acetyltransferase